VAALEHELAAAPTLGPYAIVAVADLAGNLSGTRVDFTPPPPELPRVAITEVMSHPAGPQPAQEWVELRNLSRVALSTEGLSIVAGGVADPLPVALLPPSGYAVVVAAGFSAQGPDTAPLPGAAVLRLTSPRIGAGLLDGAGEVVELRDGAGRVVSRYGGWVDVSARSLAGHSAARLDENSCDARSAWRLSAHPTPGGPNIF
jgi:hypothetical protein